MITSFFAPKSKKSSGNKRPRSGNGSGADGDGGAKAKSGRRVVSPPASAPPPSLTEETAALLSFLREHRGDDPAGRPSSWRAALERHFATSEFARLASFVAGERCVVPTPRAAAGASPSSKNRPSSH